MKSDGFVGCIEVENFSNTNLERDTEFLKLQSTLLSWIEKSSGVSIKSITNDTSTLASVILKSKEGLFVRRKGRFSLERFKTIII